MSERLNVLLRTLFSVFVPLRRHTNGFLLIKETTPRSTVLSENLLVANPEMGHPLRNSEINSRVENSPPLGRAMS